MAVITIQAGTVGDDYQGTETEPVLRVLVSQTFTALSTEIILRTLFEEGEFYAEHVCFVVAGEVNYPQFQVHSTTDALSNPDNASYTFALFTAAGEFIQVIAKRIRVPATPTTTSLALLETYNNTAPPAPTDTDLYYTKAQVNALVAAVTLLLASQADAVAGTNNTKVMTPLRVAQELAALVPSFSFASQAEAEAGVDNSKIMSPLRVAEEIAALTPILSFATQAEAEAGVNTSKLMNPLRTAQAIAVHILDTAYGVGWNGETGTAPSRNAVYDKIEAVITYADGLVTGLLDDRGNFDASGNIFPATGGSGVAGAVKKGDLWTINVAGTLGGEDIQIGDVIRALTDTPGNTLANWARTNNNISYVPENQANKSTNIAGDTGSNTKYPSVAAVETHTATKVSDTAYAGSWDGVTGVAPSKNAVYDKIEAILATGVVSDTVYGAGWDGDTTIAPSKNAVYDKIQAVIASMVGKQTVYVPASAMTPATTSGPASAQLESATNKINYSVLDFDGSSAEYAHFNIAMPKGWDEGTVTFQVIWGTTNTGTAGVAWGLQGVAESDGDTIDTAFGTAIYVTDAGQSSAAKLYITAESAAVTIGGSPSEGDLCYFRLSRDPANGSDTMTEDARLIGIRMFYTTNAATDA